jgi:hypothetical protein
MDDSSYNQPSCWDDHDRCPFCNMAISDPGSGFIDHLEKHERCSRGFEVWRGAVKNDIAGGWGG